NLHGRYDAAAPGGATLILGSHPDTLRDAGQHGRPLGGVVASAALHGLHDAGTRMPFAVEVVAFADEEGMRFSSTYLGSRALAGTFDYADLDRPDDAGITMAQAVRAFGGDPSRIGE